MEQEISQLKLENVKLMKILVYMQVRLETFINQETNMFTSVPPVEQMVNSVTRVF